MRAQLLSPWGEFGYHPVLGSAAHAATMVLFGKTAYGWRASNAFCVAMAVPLVFAFVAQLADRRAAWAANTLFASSHVLMGFCKIGYNNPQALLLLIATLYCTHVAITSRSAFRFALVAVVSALGFYSFGIARIFPLLLLGWLWLAPGWIWREKLGRSALLTGIIVVLAAPMFISLNALHAQVGHTIVYSNEVTVMQRVGIFLTNCLRGLLLFVSSAKDSHYVRGPHADPVTAILVVIGLSVVLPRALRWQRAELGLLLSYLFLTVVFAAGHHYLHPPTTRVFTLVTFYAIWGGIGFSALTRALERAMPRPLPRAAGWRFAGSVGGLAALFAANGAWEASRPVIWYPWPVAVLKVAQETPARHEPRLIAVIPGDLRPFLSLHEFGDRDVWTQTQTGPETARAICSRTTRGKLMVYVQMPGAQRLVDAVQNCWKHSVATRFSWPYGDAEFLMLESSPSDVARDVAAEGPG